MIIPPPIPANNWSLVNPHVEALLISLRTQPCVSPRFLPVRSCGLSDFVPPATSVSNRENCASIFKPGTDEGDHANSASRPVISASIFSLTDVLAIIFET